jgi:hypothetical protein
VSQWWGKLQARQSHSFSGALDPLTNLFKFKVSLRPNQHVHRPSPFVKLDHQIDPYKTSKMCYAHMMCYTHMVAVATCTESMAITRGRVCQRRLQCIVAVSILRCAVVVGEGSSRLDVLSEGAPLSLFDMLRKTEGGSRT